MVQINFDSETRTFSASKVWSTTKNVAGTPEVFMTVGGGVLGNIAGREIARRKAKKSGLEKGSKEYKKALRKGAGTGTLVGLGSGYGASKLIRGGKAYRDDRKGFKSLISGKDGKIDPELTKDDIKEFKKDWKKERPGMIKQTFAPEIGAAKSIGGLFKKKEGN